MRSPVSLPGIAAWTAAEATDAIIAAISGFSAKMKQELLRITPSKLVENSNWNVSACESFQIDF